MIIGHVIMFRFRGLKLQLKLCAPPNVYIHSHVLFLKQIVLIHRISIKFLFLFPKIILKFRDNSTFPCAQILLSCKLLITYPQLTLA
jgi:hypothetical protein